MVQFFADFLLIFQIQTAAAAVISMYQMCLRYISLVTAVTAAVPVNRASSVPLLCRIQSCQPAETSSCNIHSVPAGRICETAAAFYLSCFEIMRCHIFFISAGTPAPPACSSAFVFNSVKDCQLTVYTACQVFCFSASAGIFCLDTAAVLYSSSHQPSCIHKNLFSTVAAAPPYTVMILLSACPVNHGELSEPLSGQILSPCHSSAPFTHFSFCVCELPIRRPQLIQT